MSRTHGGVFSIIWASQPVSRMVVSIAGNNRQILVFILLLIFPYFIGSLIPKAIPVRNRSAPLIITSFFTCQ